MQKFHYALFALIALPMLASAQKIDNTSTLREIGGDRYFRLNYDNDFFSSTDQYYTQGYNFELVARFLKGNPINHLLITPKNNIVKYGIAVEHVAFTPSSIASDSILHNDRPFAAAIMLKSLAIATDTNRRSRIASSLNIGIIGPGAFGGDTQTAIHDLTGNPTPMGWQNQIKNDIVLNYELTFEKQLVETQFFSLHSVMAARLGTIFTNASVGMGAKLGIIGNPFKNAPRKFTCYVYAQPIATVVGYDATLQGGVFNKDSPYTISGEGIERFTGQIYFGAVLAYRGLFFEYSRVKSTREFDSGNAAKWGGFKIGVKL